MPLRKYQEKAITELRESLRSGHKKPLMVLPCGGGKSHIYAKVISNVIENDKKILWLVHRRNLVYQMQGILEKHFSLSPGIIMAGVESETDNPIQLSTIQTYGRRLKLRDLAFNRFFIDADVVLIDEAHRACSKTYRDVVDLYPEKIVMGCTATACRGDGKGLGQVFDDIIDVADIKDLTDQDYLSPARYFVPVNIDLGGVKLSMGDYIIKQLDKKINTPKIIGDIIENWLKLGENRKTIVFCVNVKHSIAVAEAFQEAGINAAHLDAHSSDDEREFIFSSMQRDEITVVCNVALYQEGLDVPDVSCVVMARPTKSLGLMRQCLGRGLRVADGKKDCLIFDHGGVLEEHGLLEDPISWSLSGKEIAWSRKEPQPKDPKPAQCRVCHEIFIGLNACPVCGTELKSFGKPVEAVKADLKELAPQKRNKKDDKIKKRQVYGALIWHGENKKYSYGWASHAYREYYSVWPNQHKGCPAIRPESQEIKNILTHILIKKANSYKKKLRAA